MTRGAALTGWGTAVPARICTNADLARDLPDLDDEWIVRRTGIRERRVAGPGQSTSSLATAAAASALAHAAVRPQDVGLVIVATTTPDQPTPATAPVVQARIGATNAGAFDVNAACAGFLTALAIGDAMIRTGAVRNAVVVGAEVLSRFVDGADPKTSVLFGDGAAAFVLEASDEPAGLMGIELGSDGGGSTLLEIPAGGSLLPASAETVAHNLHTVRMNGAELYRRAVRVMTDVSMRALKNAGLSVGDIDLVVPHQANQRIIDDVATHLGIDASRMVSNVARYGNTSAASVPLALAEAAQQGRLHPGARVLLCAVGAGLVWGAGVVQWTAAVPDESKAIEIGASA